MGRFFAYSLLLGLVNLIAQVAIVLITRRIDLTFGSLAGLMLIPVFEGMIVTLASPEPGQINSSTVLRTIRHDPAASLTAIAMLLFVALLATVSSSSLWTGAISAQLIIGAAFAGYSAGTIRGTDRIPLLLASVGALLIAVEINAGVLSGASKAFSAYPRVLVLIAIYVPAFIATVVALLFVEKVAKTRCPSAARMIESSIALAFVASLIVGSSFFHHPYVSEPWLGLVRALSFLAAGCLLVGGILFLRHDRGGHAEHS